MINDSEYGLVLTILLVDAVNQIDEPKLVELFGYENTALGDGEPTFAVTRTRSMQFRLRSLFFALAVLAIVSALAGRKVRKVSRARAHLKYVAQEIQATHDRLIEAPSSIGDWCLVETTEGHVRRQRTSWISHKYQMNESVVHCSIRYGVGRTPFWGVPYRTT